MANYIDCSNEETKKRVTEIINKLSHGVKEVNSMNPKVNTKIGIGTFFTPLEWAKWLLNEFGVFDSWLKGATVCDPTAGDGSFIEGCISLAKEKKITLTSDMINRLYGIEKENLFIKFFFTKVEQKYKIKFPKENFICADIILSNPNIKADILVGNPPWLNFTDLPDEYKTKIKPYFHKYNLINNSQKLLLGSSRVDIAALILSIVLNDNLNKNGDAYFFVPLSIFLNDGAHSGFRRCVLKDTKYKIESIYDFDDYTVFDDVSTRYGVVHFKRDKQNSFPIKYKIKNGGFWNDKYAASLYSNTAPLSIFENKKEFLLLKNIPSIEIKEDCKPRQGINTCGANQVFIFDADEIPSQLPHQFLFPVVSKENFFEMRPVARKFILLPYNTITGHPLTEWELKKHPKLWGYLLKHKDSLLNRKGVLINTWIKKGMWWSLLGVGKYSFAPYKVIWNAYGQKTFLSKLFSTFEGKPWQGNQSLHAYMPFYSETEAKKTLSKLSNPLIEKYLLSFKMEGTCNWAQPGKMKNLFNFSSPSFSSLFS